MSPLRTIQWACIVLLFTGIGAGPANVEPQTNPADGAAQLKQLQEKNRWLQSRNDALVIQNHELEAQLKLAQTQLSTLNILRGPAAPATPRIPDDWKRGEFNGMPVYVIPLDTGAAPIMRPANK